MFYPYYYLQIMKIFTTQSLLNKILTYL